MDRSGSYPCALVPIWRASIASLERWSKVSAGSALLQLPANAASATGYDIIEGLSKLPVNEKDFPVQLVTVSNCGELELRKGSLSLSSPLKQLAEPTPLQLPPRRLDPPLPPPPAPAPTASPPPAPLLPKIANAPRSDTARTANETRTGTGSTRSTARRRRRRTRSPRTRSGTRRRRSPS